MDANIYPLSSNTNTCAHILFHTLFSTYSYLCQTREAALQVNGERLQQEKQDLSKLYREAQMLNESIKTELARQHGISTTKIQVNCLSFQRLRVDPQMSKLSCFYRVRRDLSCFSMFSWDTQGYVSMGHAQTALFLPTQSHVRTP
jgi:hypothetical protein